MGSMGEHGPGRAVTCHRRDVVLLDRQRAAIEAVTEDEGIFFLPTGRAGGRELIDLAMKLVGSRCVVNRLGHDTSKNRELLGGDFVRGLEDDRRLAETCRGANFEHWGPKTRHRQCLSPGARLGCDPFATRHDCGDGLNQVPQAPNPPRDHWFIYVHPRDVAQAVQDRAAQSRQRLLTVGRARAESVRESALLRQPPYLVTGPHDVVRHRGLFLALRVAYRTRR